MTECIGLDIGGANIKAAHGAGEARSIPFPLWKAPEKLSSELGSLLRELPEADSLAVTMTGELADCFATKGEGVRRILAAVEEVARSRPIRVWSTSGEFLSVEEACSHELSVAAANWHAVATWWGRSRQIESGLLIDIGSTTTDIIPILEGRPQTVGLTDVGRLGAGELVYTGAVRTPVCAIVRSVPFRGREVPVAAELFSTSVDVGLLLGEIAEDSEDRETANGEAATVEAAWDRIARQICCDRRECSFEEAVAMARFIREEQLSQICRAVERVVARQSGVRFRELLLSGSGRFLAQKVLTKFPAFGSIPVIDLGELLTADLASAACAYAVARLCLEE